MKIWNGVYKNFKETGIDYVGFHDPIWFDKQIQELKNNYINKNVVKIEDHDYSLDYFVIALLAEKKIIKVCDYGGAMGQSYLRLRNKLKAKFDLEFDIIESIETIERLPDELKNLSKLKFFTDIPLKKYDLFHLGSVLQYVEDINLLFNKIKNTDAEYILINDLLAGEIPTYVTVQSYYDNPIPVYWYNFEEINSKMIDLGFELISKSNYSVKILNESSLSNLSNVPDSHKLVSSLNVIYKRG